MSATVVAMVVVAGLVPAYASAASSGAFDDPIGDTLEFAPDLGMTTIAVGDDDTIAVDSRIVPRPPAYWGGCAYYVGFPPYQTCVPSNMNVTWYLDYASQAGSVADGGADAKVVVVPSRGQVFLESDRWDSANGKFSAGAQPVWAEDAGGGRWTLRLADLGIPKPATVRLWVVSLYRSYNGLGVLTNYSDTAGPGTIAVAGGASGAADGSCEKATRKVNGLQRRIRAAKRRVEAGESGARRQLRRLLKKRKRGLKAMKGACDAPIVDGPPPSAAPPGCHLVTKPVLKQEGSGIFAEWVVKPEVVVECDK